MDKSSIKLKNKGIKMVKYFIFNLLIFSAFFIMNLGFNVHAEEAAAETPATGSVVYKVFGSNYQGKDKEGDNTSNNAVRICDANTPTAESATCNKTLSGHTSYASGWYIQTRGEANKDTVAIQLVITTNIKRITGFVAYESGYSTSSGIANGYDSYVRDLNDVWDVQLGTGLSAGKVLTAWGSDDADNATSADLIANGTSGEKVYSMFYVVSETYNADTKLTTITINYVYTIRSNDFGKKQIEFIIYDDEAYDYTTGTIQKPISAATFEITFVASKPASDFGVQWLDSADEIANSKGTDGTADVNQTNKIYIEYVNNATGGNTARDMLFYLPMEMAYLHDVSGTTIPSGSNLGIEGNSIYGVNTFKNTPQTAGKYVRYYYWNFLPNDTSTYNYSLDPTVDYVLKLSVDASGSYVFYITDIFGNRITNDLDKTIVDDVSITNVIVDYISANGTTNPSAVDLTIMSATSSYTSGWKNDWTFVIDATLIDFRKMKADETTVTFHTFHKVVINNGVPGTNFSDYEPIAKQPLGYKDGGDADNNPNQFDDNGISIWRVETITGDDGSSENVSCGTGCYSDLTFAVGDYGDGARKNKVTFKITNNGRYRVMITDNYTNTTDTLSGDEKNPKVEVTVLDRTDPVITSALSNNASTSSTSIESFAYVIGGGEKDKTYPGSLTDDADGNHYYQIADNYTKIYYNVAGSKIFNYQDALEIAKIKVVDNTLYYASNSHDNIYSNYKVYMNALTDAGASDGTYNDPSAGYKSDRNASGTTTNNDLHTYIISNNVTSFTGGLVKQVGYTDYDADNATNYTKIDGGNTAVEFVNKNDATAFLGYLKIVFKSMEGTNAEICSLTIDMTADSASTSNATNETCFETINKMIDDVENFKMEFSTVDYLGNTSNTYTVEVTVVDTTSPGIDMTGINDANRIFYTNTVDGNTCRLEIDNPIQIKTKLLECYKIKVVGENVYKIKDNNVEISGVNYASDAGTQYYTKATTGYSYFDKIVLSILEEGSSWKTITDDISTNPTLLKSGDHQFKLVISDHWGSLTPAEASYTADNKITIFLNYYVNPRTLLIEPLVNDKMYGEEDPTFDYCVYVNRDNSTFNLEGKFFEPEFINEYFTHIYCTKNVYQEIKNADRYKRVDGTENKGYAYHTYTRDNNGEYLKINNTYVLITNAQKYNATYELNTTEKGGEFLKEGSTYYPILSGYKYKDASCTLAYMGTGTAHLKTVGGCKEIKTGASGNTYSVKYTQNDSGTYLKYNINDANGNANDALVNSNVFQGALTRVESSCYNGFSAGDGFAAHLNCQDKTQTRNDNVGQYHIVLGTLSIKEDDLNSDNVIDEDDTDYNADYVIKLNTNYWATNTNLDPTGTQDRDIKIGGKLVDDTIFAESTVNFTIRQAVLTITANGSSKKFGEQDPYSNVWNDKTTQIQNHADKTGYLGGYSVHGWRYGDGNKGNSTALGSGTDKYIIEGYLRRQSGEEVGIYNICNYNGAPNNLSITDCKTGSSAAPTGYSDNLYQFADYGAYLANGTSSTASLTIRTNGEIYGRNVTGRTLNTDTRNYAILYIKAEMTIEAINLVIQPGINQGKEYAKTAYHDPLWQLVVYGETITHNGTSWESNIKTSSSDSTFSGYTDTIAVEQNKNETTGYEYLGQLGVNSPYYSADSEIYYSRRKTSPVATYKYTENLKLDDYTRYAYASNIYYEKADGEYIYAYGKYYKVENTTTIDGEVYLPVEVVGRLVNETYSLFYHDNDFDTFTNDFVVKREMGENVGWYSYNAISNFRVEVDGESTKTIYTIRGVENSANECTVAANSVTVTSSGTTKCRNYNVNYIDNAPEYTAASNLYTTASGGSEIYRPNGIDACTDASVYSLACPDTKKTKITFEIFKREIILEFIDDNYTFIYGERYDYYDGGTASGSGYTYNTNSNGVFNIKNNSSEGNIFLCYSDLGNYLVDCTENGDYGITTGDTWTGIGLKFYLHSVVSSFSGGYYDTDTNKALPAGKYFVYAAIGQLTIDETNANLDEEAEVRDANNTILNNYKFTYKGGTLTIKPKVTSIELTGYTMEYGESTYYSYGTGTKYSDYTVYTTQCMKDVSYTAGTGLITDCSETDGTGKTGNVVGNTYGFTVEGLDRLDTIANNFNGRPYRESTRTNNVGVFDDVGYYKIKVLDASSNPTITPILDSTVNKTTTFKECSTAGGDCVFDSSTSSVNAINYDITYSINHNEGAYLFITPAKLDVTVDAGQTKMYGCAYYEYQVDASKYYDGYTYETGYVYDSCDPQKTDSKLDLAYQYKVNGDKDVNAKYTVTTNADGTRKVTADETKLKADGKTIEAGKISLTDTRLYRVTKTANNIYEYGDIRTTENIAKYQGQKVGVYTITLGALNVSENVNTMCDAYNNPVLEGGIKCRNYDINYYGNSTTTAISDHEYVNKTEVEVSKLALYTLNYTANTSGGYILLDGKFVRIEDIKTANAGKGLVNSYVLKSSLPKYKKVSEYVESTDTCNSNSADCYIKLDGEYKLISDLSGNRYTDFSGTSQSNTGDYLKVTKSGKNNFIKLSTITKFKKSSDRYLVDATNGEYVEINDEFVQLSSLKSYACTLVDDKVSTCSANDSGDYVLKYKERTLGDDFVKYALTANNATMYVLNKDASITSNTYVFIDGTYVPYDSLNIYTNADSKQVISVNMARVWNADKSGTEDTRGDSATDTDFDITARIVYVHPEYNVKPYGDDDPIEYITCAEIESAYELTDANKTGRTYCSDYTNGKIDLGTTMYYAVQNSLAKAPWTAWTDKNTYVTGSTDYTLYNDIQFDVLTGKISRKMITNLDNADETKRGKKDTAGRYTYDFANVTTNAALNGDNYMIVHVTNYDMDNTYIQKDDGSYATVASLVYDDTCANGDKNCANGEKVGTNGFKIIVNSSGKASANGTLTSISLVDKYYKDGEAYKPISFWYLGFYKEDTSSEDRDGELAKWWVNRDPFSTSYDELKLSAATASQDKKDVNHIEDPYFEGKVEVYFEIIRRTIYLYAVDAEKTYGEADNYADLKVAICGNALGYEVTADGKVKCKSTTNAKAYGLSTDDLAIFVDEDGYMLQERIKNNGNKAADGTTDIPYNYIFKGQTHKTHSFGIYFRRANSENAGHYTLTACAAQSDITDCTDLSQKEKEGTAIQVLGDNYKIIEVSGVFTINTREVSVTPHEGQGFQYGNYTVDGSMPNITFTESHDGGNGLVFGDGVYLFNSSGVEVAKITTTKDSKLVNEFTIDGTRYYIDGLNVIKETTKELVGSVTITVTGGVNTKKLSLKVGVTTTVYTIVQKAVCLINVSGLYTICINDAQNEQLANGLDDADYWQYGADYAAAGQLGQTVYNGATGVVVNGVNKEYYNYNVYADKYSDPAEINKRKENDGTNYPRHALSLACGDNTDVRYSRDVCEYSITAGDLTISDNVKITTTFYVHLMASKRYSYNESTGEYTQADGGDYIKYAEGKYAKIVTEGTGANTYILKTTGYELNAEGNYVKVEVVTYNYAIESIDTSKKFNVTAAGLTVTPVDKQYKIYGEKDPEIEFTVETQYTAASTHYQAYSDNLTALCNDTCISGDALKPYRYNLSSGVYSQNDAGTYILIIKGWTVKLNTYAYNEKNTGSDNLDYGKNLGSVKHLNTTSSLSQGTAGVKHFDKYATYEETISTSRILIGNLYVKDYSQSVGEKYITSGLKVALNNLNAVNGGKSNYILTFAEDTYYFVVIPRPVNIEIANIEKMYGQATDKYSCDSYDNECIVGEGILISDGTGANEDTNESSLANNFNILAKTIGSDDKATLNSTHVTGIAVDYAGKTNMPTVKSTAFTGDYGSYVTVETGHYYTDTYAEGSTNGVQERKNATLNIKVERDSNEGKYYNIARGTDDCLVSGDAHGCEDVGEYFLKFNHRSETASVANSTITSGYYNRYWGYNPNYYVIIYNNFEVSDWSENETKAVADGGQGYSSITENKDLYYGKVMNSTASGYGTYTDNAKPTPTATLKIRKRPIQIVVETMEYTYEQADAGLYLKVNTNKENPAQDPKYEYFLITDTNRYNKVSGKYVQSKTGTYLCEYIAGNQNTDNNCHEIIVGNRYNRESSKVGERYTIEQNMDVPALPVANNTETIHHTTYDTSTHTGYVTWYEHPRQVRTADELYGNVAYCNGRLTIGGTTTLDTIRTGACSGKNQDPTRMNGEEYEDASLKYYYGSYNPNDNALVGGKTKDTFFYTGANGHYIITRDVNATGENGLYVRNGTGITSIAYENNNYSTTFINGVLQIDLDETAPIINVGTEFIVQEANGGTLIGNGNGTILGFLENDEMKNNYCASLTTSRDADGKIINCKKADGTVIVFTYEDNNLNSAISETISWNYISTLLDWFDVKSYETSVMRAGAAVPKRYDPRWYITIQNDFDQKKTGDYTVFIYAQDDAGNISLATTVTLRVKDETKPKTGTLYLFDTEVTCQNGKDCNKLENWEVKRDTYLPISSFTEAKLNALGGQKDSITAVKWAYDTINGTYTDTHAFGTYYKIPAGVSAQVVLHTGWVNTDIIDNADGIVDGIYMVVIGGDDNTLAYLDTSKYSDKYTVAANGSFTKGTTGTHLLYGTLIDLDNLTKYRKVELNGSGNEVATSGTSTVYLPDKSGQYIRYKGYYYDLVNGTYVGGTTPTEEYQVKLYKLDDSTYSKVVDGKASRDATDSSVFADGYYLVDGTFYEIPTTKYTKSGSEYKHDNTNGTYINIAQWDNYYSRDGGLSWIKYDRNTMDGYLALGQDGQRLIMIKAVDTGYTYDTTKPIKSFTNSAYMQKAKCEVGGVETDCFTWNDVGIDKGNNITIESGKVIATPSTNGEYTEYNGGKLAKYNISDWEEYNADGNRDMKFAYLDTILPIVNLGGNLDLEPYQYGCENCTRNHDEKFGTVTDSYVYPLGSLMKYVVDATAADGYKPNKLSEGTHVKVNGKYIEIADATIKRRLTKSTATGDTKYCIGDSGTGCMYRYDDNGTYIYLGTIDSVATADTTITGVINKDGRLSALYNDATDEKLKVFDKNKGEAIEIAIGSSASGEDLNNLKANTLYNESGVDNSATTDTFKGTGNAATSFGTGSNIEDKYVTMFVYTEISGGGATITNPYYGTKGKGYYKHLVEYDKDTEKYVIKQCYSSSTMFVESTWCNASDITEFGGFETIKEAINALTAVYKAKSASDTSNAYDFGGNNVVHTIDYRVSDLAGNMSLYVRKGIIIASFTTYITPVNQSAAALSNRVEINLDQNSDITQALGNFAIGSGSGAMLKSEEEILQTIYYNGVVVSENQKYNLSALSNIDTSVPGEYKVVYSVRRKDGTKYVYGNEVELLVTINPIVADADSENVDYLALAMILMSTISIGAIYWIVTNKKKKA